MLLGIWPPTFDLNLAGFVWLAGEFLFCSWAWFTGVDAFHSIVRNLRQ